MRSTRRTAGLLFLLALGGCGSCQRGDGNGTSSPTGAADAVPPAAESAATPQARIAIPTIARAPQFAATQPAAPAEAPPDEAAAEDTPGAEPFGQGDCVVIIDADPDFGQPPLSVNFSVEAQCNSGAPTYTWDFGDNSTPSTEPAPIHVYQKAGEYTVTLKAIAPDGTQASDDIAITVEEELDQ